MTIGPDPGRLAESIQAQRPPPCERPTRCPRWQECADGKLGCELWAMYVVGPKAAGNRGRKPIRGARLRPLSKVERGP